MANLNSIIQSQSDKSQTVDNQTIQQETTITEQNGEVLTTVDATFILNTLLDIKNIVISMVDKISSLDERMSSLEEEISSNKKKERNE